MVRSISAHAPNLLSSSKEAFLYQTALKVFLSKGLDAARMDDIAKKAGVAKSTIYRRFSSKEELFEKVLLDKADALAGQMGTLVMDVENPLESLENAARAVRRLTLENIDYQRMLIAESPRRRKLTQEIRVRINRLLIEKMKSFFTHLVSRGKMDDVDLDHIVFSFLILSVGGWRPLFNVMTIDDPSTDDSRLQTDLQLFIKGCGITA